MRKGTNVPRGKWGRHRRLLENPDVKRWYDNLARGSPVTADVRLRRLGVYCETAGTTPEEFAGTGAREVRAVDDLLMDHVSLLESRGYAPSYIEDILKSLRSWLSFNYVRSVRRIRIKNADIPVTLQDEVVPSKAKLGELLDSAPARERVSISLMAFSGVRPEVLGDYYGRDGLKVSDIEGMEVGGDVSFAQMPARVTVRAALSKAGHRYFTFLPETGCRYLRGYLRERMAGGEPVGADSPIITFRPGYRTKTARDACHLRTVSITAAIKDAFGVIIKGRPYVLRSYFDTQLLLAESQGRMTHAYRQFFMGHKGDIEARYTTNKHRLGDAVIRDMREAYVRSQSMLSPFERDEERKDRRETLLEMWRDQAKMYGIDPVKVRIERQRVRQKGDVGSPDPADLEMDAIKDAIRKTMQPAAAGMRMPWPAGAGSYESRLVDCEEDLLSCVSQGWDVIRELSQGRILLRRGTGPAAGVPQHPDQ